MQNITIEPPDMWAYFQENKEELASSMHEVASNDEYGTVIYLTEEVGYPKFIVNADDREVFSGGAISARDCLETTEQLYIDFLTSKAIDRIKALSDDKKYTALDTQDEIDQREMELDDAFYRLVETALGGYAGYSIEIDAACEDIKELVLERLARKHGLPIYRPMILVDDDGNEFFEEYPYEHMVFDDEEED